MSNNILNRETFTTSRAMEYFTEKELKMQIGAPKELWPVTLIKELIDNSLDACEGAGVAPEIEVFIGPDAFTVCDNGPGLPEAVIRRSLDYLVRVSNKAYYVSPTRGQLGNALKCVWAAPFVFSQGRAGRIRIETGSNAYNVVITTDPVKQEPKIGLTVDTDVFVKNGTAVTVDWPGVACYLERLKESGFYNFVGVDTILRNYAAFNPHATFSLTMGEAGARTYAPTSTEWRKWLPSNPTSPHWYDAARLRSLMAAYVGAEADGGRVRTVREFVSEFNGLSATAKQKAVTESCMNLPGKYLHDFDFGSPATLGTIGDLLTTMQEHSRKIPATALGVIGEKHVKEVLARDHYADPESIRYKRTDGITRTGVPFVCEVAFGVHREEHQNEGRLRIMGVNWSAALTDSPFPELRETINTIRLDAHDPVSLFLHMCLPRVEFSDKGKGNLHV